MNVDHQICLHCGACAGACPTNSIFLLETSVIEFLPTCTDCGLCVIACPTGAITMSSCEAFPMPPTQAGAKGEIHL